MKLTQKWISYCFNLTFSSIKIPSSARANPSLLKVYIISQKTIPSSIVFHIFHLFRPVFMLVLSRYSDEIILVSTKNSLSLDCYWFCIALWYSSESRPFFTNSESSDFGFYLNSHPLHQQECASISFLWNNIRICWPFHWENPDRSWLT